MLQELLNNYVLKTALFAWALAQLLKVIFVLLTQKMGF